MKRWTKIILFVLALTAAFIWVEVAKSPTADQADESVRLYFFNVGQGDSEMIEKGNCQILIDGGPDDKVLAEMGKAMPISDRKIDVLILTHPHADHLVGLNQILDRYEVGKIYYSGVDYSSSIYKEFLDKIESKNISTEIPQIGTKVDPFPNGELEFLWPGKKYLDKKIDADLNNTSEVAKFCYFSHCALFTGDIETDEQKLMFDSYSVDSQNIFQAEILKPSHHGSSNGTNQLILDKVKPTAAIIEVGVDNKYGHPHAATLDLLQKGNIQQYRTDKDSTIEFIINQDVFIKK